MQTVLPFLLFTYLAEYCAILLAFALHFHAECALWSTHSYRQLTSTSAACVANEARLEGG